MSLLAVRDLRTGYGGIPVVFKVDLEVGDAEVVALLGANGAGKTTTLRAISGMIRVMSGDIVFAGERISNRPADQIARRGLVHVPEGRGIFPSLRVDETLRLAATMAGAPRGEATARIDEVYATFPRLADRRTQTAGTLSGGEQQMLTLARGLISRPRLLLIDEMSQGLAPTLVASLFEIVATFPRRGISVLLVEQFVGQALRVASRAYVLEKGDAGAEVEGVGRRRRWTAAQEQAAAAAVPPAMPSVLVRALEELAKREGVPVAEMIRQALEENGAEASRAPVVSRGARDDS